MDIYWSLFPLYSIDKAIYERYLDMKDMLKDPVVVLPVLLIHFWGIRLAA